MNLRKIINLDNYGEHVIEMIDLVAVSPLDPSLVALWKHI